MTKGPKKTPPKWEIFVDVDGTVADWIGSVCKLFGITEDDLVAPRFSPDDTLGITEEAMWERVEEEGVEFWSNLEPYPWSKELVDELAKLGRVSFLTSPHLDSNGYCLGGKGIWLDRNFHGRNAIFAKTKHLLAGPRRILIDDYGRKIKEFEKAGGYGVLVPRKWNSAGDYDGDYKALILSKVRDIIESEDGS